LHLTFDFSKGKKQQKRVAKGKKYDIIYKRADEASETFFEKQTEKTQRQ